MGDMDYQAAIDLMRAVRDAEEEIIALISASEAKHDQVTLMLAQLSEGTGMSTNAPVMGYANGVGNSLTEAKVNAHAVYTIMGTGIARLS